MNCAGRALLALFAVTLATTGCGGGGGDDNGAAPTVVATPLSGTPLAITPANAPNLASLAPATGEAVLTVAQFAVDSVRRFALPGTASPLVTTCPNGGVLTVTLTDRDGDGAASAGDRVVVDARDCAVPVITDVVAGTIQIDLAMPSGPPASGLRAAVSLPGGLRFGDSPTDAVRLFGSLQIDWMSTVVETTLHVSPSGDDDLRVVVPAGVNAPLTESIRHPDITKQLKYDEARAVVSMAFRYDSEVLKGSIIVATPQPLRAYLNTYPETGRIEVSGAAGSKVVLTPNFVSSSYQFQYAFDSDNDGNADASGGVNWSDSVLGYLWWDGVTALNGWSTNVFSTRAFTATDFFPTVSFNWTTSSASSFRLQFSRPLASTTPTLLFRFVDRGALSYDNTPLVNVAATTEVHGALMVVTPSAPLRHARLYALEVSLDGRDWNGVSIQDMLGNSTNSNAWSGLSLTTPSTLAAVATAQTGALLGASDQVVLTGQSSTSTRPIVAYQWTQVAGTPLHFDNVATAQASVSWGNVPPNGVEQAVIRLTVTDTAGDTDSSDVTIMSASLANSSHVLYFRSAVGDYIGMGGTALIDTNAAQFQESMNAGYLRASIISPGYSSWWYLDLADGDGSPWHVGAYENAIRAAFRGNQNGVDFSGNGRGCNETSGRFDVLEIQTDGAGTITKLAVDFEQHCEGASAPALLGSYRINSTVPIRR